MAKSAKVLVFQGLPAVRELNSSLVGTLEGIATTPSGPLAGATIRLWDQSWKLYGAVQTDAAGTFRFEAVPQGAHVVSIDVPPGYVADEQDTSVNVATGLNQVQFRLRPSGHLNGRVVDSDQGKPMADVEVELVDAKGKPLARATTSKTGDYEFAGLLASDYQVRLRSS